MFMRRFPVAARLMPRAAILAAAAAVIALAVPAGASAAPAAGPSGSGVVTPAAAGTFSATPLAGSTTLESTCTHKIETSPSVEFVVCADLIEFEGDLWGQTETYCQTPGGTLLACGEVVATVEGASASASGQVSVGQGALLVECGTGGHSPCQVQKNFSKAQVAGAVPGNGPCQAWGVLDDVSHPAPGAHVVPRIAYADSAGNAVTEIITTDLGSNHDSAACAA
jgi:hypothetical protein